MALQINGPWPLTRSHHPYPHPLLHHTNLLLSKSKPNLSIKSQKSTTDAEPPPNDPPPKKQAPPSGLGFGTGTTASSQPSASSTKSPPGSSKKKHKGKRASSITRRSPVEKPAFPMSPEDEAKLEEQKKNESAFLLAWLGLGALILVQGVALAASGFLPEAWDKFFVKYLYPSFTPTVFLFVGGTVAYGVLKYQQNENIKDQK